jgi:alkaline phosphatase
MKKLNSLLFLLSFLFILFSCNKSAQRLSQTDGKAKNIILLIGDGMGFAQLSSVYYFGESPRSFSRFRYIGLHQNTPVGEKITDSASGATAFSMGVKTYNAAIGLDKDSLPHETILEWAAKQGKSTGLIATSSITHATPASFYAHVKHRNFHEDIAHDFVKSPADFAAAGGYNFFCHRSDGKNLLDSLAAKGVKTDTVRLGARHQPGERYTYLLAPDSLLSVVNGRGDFLPKATTAALDFLSADPDGFFLMVEGSQIDWAGHYNQAKYLIGEMADFDFAIQAALDFAEKDGNTLVIVTADHETGGYALSAPVVFGKTDYGNISPTFSTGGHTASLIPVFAFGPGAERFMGIYQNNEIYRKMMDSYGK